MYKSFKNMDQDAQSEGVGLETLGAGFNFQQRKLITQKKSFML